MENMTYKEHGFQMFRNLFSGPALEVLQRQLRYEVRKRKNEDTLKVGDGQVTDRAALGRIAISEAVLHTVKPIIEEAAGEEILATYAYPVINLPGAILKRHTDRQACEFTATVTIYNEPEGIIWPIYAQTEDREELKIMLNPGDMCFYDGITCDHWRDSLPDDQYNISIFLHYVRKNGEYTKWADVESQDEYTDNTIVEILAEMDNE